MCGGEASLLILGAAGSRPLSLVVFKHRGFGPQGHWAELDDVLIVNLGDMLGIWRAEVRGTADTYLPWTYFL